MRAALLALALMAAPAAAANVQQIVNAGTDCASYDPPEDCVPYGEAPDIRINQGSTPRSLVSFLYSPAPPAKDTIVLYAVPDVMMVFRNASGEEIGRLTQDNHNQFQFHGSADQSAALFFRYLTDRMEGWMIDHCEPAKKR